MTEATRPFSEGAANGGGHGDDPLQKRVHEGPRGGARTWYEVLEVPADVSAVDLKKAYDRALALVEGRNIGGYLMLDPLAAESARADVEAAFAVLGDADRRRGYDERLRAAGGDDAPPARDKAVVVQDRPADDEQRNARELLAIEEAQKDKSASSSGLRFTAPAEPSEEGPVSPGVASAADAPREVTFGGRAGMRPASAAIRFDIPKTGPGEQAAPAKRISIIAPAEEVGSAVFTNTPHEASATIPPEAQMPAPTPPGSVIPSGPAEPTKAGLPDTGEIPGALIRELREARGLSLEDLAEATKIRKPYLRAVEEEDAQNLPDRVYLRGFLTQIARVLKVDRARLAEGYLLTVERVTKDAPPSAT